MNTNFKVVCLTRLGIKPKSTVTEVDALTTRPSELFKFYCVENLTLIEGDREVSLRCSSQQPPVVADMSNAIGSSRESNP